MDVNIFIFLSPLPNNIFIYTKFDDMSVFPEYEMLDLDKFPIEFIPIGKEDVLCPNGVQVIMVFDGRKHIFNLTKIAVYEMLKYHNSL